MTCLGDRRDIGSCAGRALGHPGEDGLSTIMGKGGRRLSKTRNSWAMVSGRGCLVAMSRGTKTIVYFST